MIECTCGYLHAGCCAFDGPVNGPCSADATIAIELDDMRRLYCATHAGLHEVAALVFGFDVIRLEDEERGDPSGLGCAGPSA